MIMVISTMRATPDYLLPLPPIDIQSNPTLLLPWLESFTMRLEGHMMSVKGCWQLG
jgi:hypothetical protein